MQNNSNSNTNAKDPNETIETIGEKPDSFSTQINTYYPYPIVNAAIAIIVFFILGKFVNWIVSRFIKGLVKKTKTNFDDDVLRYIHRPIFVSVLLIGLSFATYLLSQPERITSITIHILQTIAVLVWARFLFRLFSLVLDEVELKETKVNFITPTTKPLINNTISIILLALTVYAIFLIWGINITAWIASAGIIGLAISFAAKDTLANVFGGVTIFADKPFKVGDFVNLSGGERGVITQIGIRSTRILTRDDIEITVPNGVLATTTIVNESGGPYEKFRIRVKVGVAYGSDIDQVEDTLLRIAINHVEICQTPEPRVRLRNFGASSLDYELLCWVERPVLRGRVLHELNRHVYKTFQEENIEIPFPQQDIYIKHLPKQGNN